MRHVRMLLFLFMAASLATDEDSDVYSDDDFAGRCTEDYVDSDAEDISREASTGASASNAPAPAPSASNHRKANRKKGSVWPCSDAQREHIIKRRKAFQSNAKSVLALANSGAGTSGGAGWIIPAPSTLRGTTGTASPSIFWLHAWGCWAPEIIFDEVLMPPCPICGCYKLVVRLRWRGHGPRVVLGDRAPWYLDSYVYQCSKPGCGNFLPTHSDSIRNLPPRARASFHVFLGQRSAISGPLADRIFHLWATPMSSGMISNVLAADFHCEYVARTEAYWALALETGASSASALPAQTGLLDDVVIHTTALYTYGTADRISLLSLLCHWPRPDHFGVLGICNYMKEYNYEFSISQTVILYVII